MGAAGRSHALLAPRRLAADPERARADELQPLPWPRPRFGIAGVRAAAAYTCFVILNHSVLSPIFDDPADADAIARPGAMFPGRDVIGIDSRALIEHGGSLRAAVMTLPQPLQLGPSTAVLTPT